jgi:hypothetical protein
MELHLTERACKLGPSINCRTEKHGDEDEPACDIPITGILLEKDEANELVGALFWESLFDSSGAGKGKAPKVLFPHLAPRKLTDKYQGNISIVLGPNINDVELEKITFTGITLEPIEGGLVSLSLKVQCSDSIEKFIHKLVARQNTEIDVEIDFGEKVVQTKGKQDELPLEGAAPTSGKKGEDHAAAGEAQAAALSRSTPINGSKAH